MCSGSNQEQFESVLSLAEHLFQMIPQDVWREHGAEWMGQYEGDRHAEKVLEQLRAWRGSNPANEPRGNDSEIRRMLYPTPSPRFGATSTQSEASAKGNEAAAGAGESSPVKERDA